MTDLQAVLDCWRADAAVLRRNGETRLADALDRCAHEAAASAVEWLTWLSEGDATLRSGFSPKWLRHRREAWARDGHARRQGRSWSYRAAIVPRRANLATAAEDGRRAALRAA